MKVTIICVGKIKEDFFKNAIEEYKKRLSKYIKINIIEVLDEKAPQNISDTEKENIKKKEGEKILKHIQNKYVFALCIEGIAMDSVSFAKKLQGIKNSSIADIAFVIGGSLGLCKDVLKQADFKISFSQMTFPHNLMRIILLEQLYRAEKILKNEPYHK